MDMVVGMRGVQAFSRNVVQCKKVSVGEYEAVYMTRKDVEHLHIYMANMSRCYRSAQRDI